MLLRVAVGIGRSGNNCDFKVTVDFVVFTDPSTEHVYLSKDIFFFCAFFFLFSVLLSPPSYHHVWDWNVAEWTLWLL